MSWWQIDGETGGINWSSRGPDGAVLCNQIPGKAPRENYYNGDEPADILDKVINTMIDKLIDPEYKNAARNAFLGQPVDDLEIDLIHKQSLENACRRITRVYERAWSREPYFEELAGVFEFCTAFIAGNPAVRVGE
jgi:hypothetical protein